MKRLVLALGLVIFFPLAASAALIAAGSVDGGARFFAIDNDLTSTCGTPALAPCQFPDLNPIEGILALGASGLAGGDLDVQATVQTSNAGIVNRLDSTGTQLTNTGTVSHSFIGVVSDTDFTGPATRAFTTGAGQWSHLGAGFGDSEINMQWFNDPANGQGALTTGINQPGLLIDAFSDVAGAANPDSFSHIGGPFAVADPSLFSMTLRFDGVIAPGVRLTGREQTELKPVSVAQVNPLLLMGLGASVLGVVAAVRRRA